jgi:hypothetical protein
MKSIKKYKAMKTITIATGLLVAGLILANPCSGQMNSDSIMIRKAIRMLKKANAGNAITVTFGLASNIYMARIGGFPLEPKVNADPGVCITHASIAMARIFSSITPPVDVCKARRILKPWRESPEMAASCRKLFNVLDAAQILTGVAPVLCVSGGIMMFVASNQHVYHVEDDYGFSYDVRTTNQGLKTAGWVLVGAGLAASFSSAILIGISNGMLREKMGSLSLKAGPAGVGLQYNLPEGH